MRHVRSNWTGAVLVCGKCSRKLDGGFGRKGRTPLAKALRRALELGKGRKASLGVVETPCLKLCPKRAVAMVDTRRPGDWLIVPEGADVEELAAKLSPVGTVPDASSPRSAGVALRGFPDQGDHVGNALSAVGAQLCLEIEGRELAFDICRDDIGGYPVLHRQ